MEMRKARYGGGVEGWRHRNAAAGSLDRLVVVRCLDERCASTHAHAKNEAARRMARRSNNGRKDLFGSRKEPVTPCNDPAIGCAHVASNAQRCLGSRALASGASRSAGGPASTSAGRGLSVAPPTRLPHWGSGTPRRWRKTGLDTGEHRQRDGRFVSSLTHAPRGPRRSGIPSNFSNISKILTPWHAPECARGQGRHCTRCRPRLANSNTSRDALSDSKAGRSPPSSQGASPQGASSQVCPREGADRGVPEPRTRLSSQSYGKNSPRAEHELAQTDSSMSQPPLFGGGVYDRRHMARIIRKVDVHKKTSSLVGASTDWRCLHNSPLLEGERRVTAAKCRQPSATQACDACLLHSAAGQSPTRAPAKRSCRR